MDERIIQLRSKIFKTFDKLNQIGEGESSDEVCIAEETKDDELNADPNTPEKYDSIMNPNDRFITKLN